MSKFVGYPYLALVNEFEIDDMDQSIVLVSIILVRDAARSHGALPASSQ